MARLLRLALDAPRPVLAIVLATLVAAVAIAVQMVTAAEIVAAFFGPGRTHSSGQLWQSALLWLLLGAVIVRAAAAGTGETAAARLATRIKSRLRLDAAASLIAQARMHADDRTGELVTTVVDGVEKLDLFYRRFVPQAIATAIIPTAIVIVVAWLDIPSALLLALTGPLIPLFMWLLGTAAAAKARAQWVALGVLGARFLDTLEGLPTLTAFGRAPEAALALGDASEQLRLKTMSVVRVAFLSGFVLELAASVSTALVAASIGVRLIEGWMEFSTGLAVLLLTPEFYLPFRQLGQRHHAGMEGVAAADRIFGVIDEGPGRSLEVRHAKFSVAAADRRNEIPTLSVRRLSYIYPGADALALQDVSLTFAPRTLTAIVGESGAGKSTLLDLIAGLMTPPPGTTFVNGSDAAEVDPMPWRQQFAHVPQRPRFLHGTVADNIRLACPRATRAEIVAAAQLAHADEFISKLPDGYDTVIDDSASTLSGGERQRLALARALLKPASFLVLDEPTSSLDAATEALINDTLTNAKRDRTVIVATHRLLITRGADQCVRITGGRLDVPAASATREVA